MNGRFSSSDSSSDALLRQKERLIQVMVRETSKDVGIRDDLLQEGRLKLVQVAQSHPDQSEAYWHTAVRQRIQEVSERRTWTGHGRAQGHPRDPMLRERASFDDPYFTYDPTQTIAQPPGNQDLAPHLDEIHAAVATLPETGRAYVLDRFWKGLTNPEIGRAEKVGRGEIERRWRIHFRPALAEKLAHLKECA